MLSLSLSLCDTGATKLHTRMSQCWHLLPWWCSTLGSVSDLRQMLYTWECVWCETDALHLGVCLMWERWSALGSVSDVRQMLYTWECVWCEKDGLHLGVCLIWDRCCTLGSVSDVRKMVCTRSVSDLRQMLYTWECVWCEKDALHLGVCLMWGKKHTLHLQVWMRCEKKKKLYTCKCVWCEEKKLHTCKCVWWGKRKKSSTLASVCDVKNYPQLHCGLHGHGQQAFAVLAEWCSTSLSVDQLQSGLTDLCFSLIQFSTDLRLRCRLVIALHDGKFL